MAYIGNAGEKFTASVTLTNIYEYINYSFSYYGTTNYIYTMKDDNGNVIVWKTTSTMKVKTEEKRRPGDDPLSYLIKKGDKVQITGTVKEHSIYKGEEQTLLQRAKVKLIEKSPSWEEKKASKQDEQMQTLKGGDLLWTMPYRQYKEHYSDCETLYGSYTEADKYSHAMITVIIREGRLKASGVRGEHYSGYQMQNENGEKITYRAVKEENAFKRVQRDFPDHTWECVKIFNYDTHNVW